MFLFYLCVYEKRKEAIDLIQREQITLEAETDKYLKKHMTNTYSTQNVTSIYNIHVE